MYKLFFCVRRGSPSPAADPRGAVVHRRVRRLPDQQGGGADKAREADERVVEEAVTERMVVGRAAGRAAEQGVAVA